MLLCCCVMRLVSNLQSSKVLTLVNCCAQTVTVGGATVTFTGFIVVTATGPYAGTNEAPGNKASFKILIDPLKSQTPGMLQWCGDCAAPRCLSSPVQLSDRRQRKMLMGRFSSAGADQPERWRGVPVCPGAIRHHRQVGSRCAGFARLLYSRL